MQRLDENHRETAPVARVVQRTAPTGRLVRLLLLGAPLWLLTLAAPAGWLYGLAYWILLAVLVSAELRRLPGAREIDISRSVPRRFSLRSEQSIGLNLGNRSSQPLHVKVFDEVPESLLPLHQLPASLLPARSSAELRLRVRPVVRGDYEFGPMRLRTQLPNGLLERRISVHQSSKARVYPRFLEVKQYHLLAKIDERDEVTRRPRRTRGAGSDFESLRLYVSGDDLRKVDWKASARRGALISREFQVERGQQLAILIDCGRLMAGRIGEEPRLEHAFNAAVMLAYVAQKRGDTVAVSTFSNRIESFMPPTKGHAILPSVLENLYQVQVQEVESDYWQVIAEMMAMLKRRSLVLVMTDVLDPVSSSGLINNLYRASAKHLVLCVVLSEPRIEAVADSAPADAQSVYRKAAACHLRLERHLALEKLRTRGILVLETAPHHLSVQLVRQYLEIRRADLQ